MISDEDARLFFRKSLEVPGVFGGKGSLQIFRGKPLHLVDNMPPGSCQRHKKVFDQFGAIPEYCFECYKVLVAPRTVLELFKLLMAFETPALPNNNRRKCMVEGRADCAGAYKGFVYCRGASEGEEMHRTIQAMVADAISPDVPVTLKRGCSEFAHAHPEYAQINAGSVLMKYPQDWKVHEEFVDQTYTWPPLPEAYDADVCVGGDRTYPPREIFAMQHWLRYAATIGDATYLQIAGKTMPPLPNLNRPR